MIQRSAMAIKAAIKRCLQQTICVLFIIANSAALYAAEPIDGLGKLTATGLAKKDGRADRAVAVASMNLCTDQLLLLLADQKNITSVSDLGADPQYSYMAKKAQGLPTNTGQAEQLISQAPDVVLAGEYSDKAALSQLAAFGIPTVVLPLSRGLVSIAEQIRDVASAIGEQERGEALITALDARLKQADASVPRAGRKPVALIYAPNGFTHGKNTLYDEILTRAGMINAASESGMQGHGYMTLEQVLEMQPDFLILEDSAGSSGNRNSMAQRMLSHPALVRGLPNTRYLRVPANLWTCPGPSSIRAIELLIEQRQHIDE